MDYMTLAALATLGILLMGIGWRQYRKANPPPPTFAEAMAYLDEQLKNPVVPSDEDIEASNRKQMEEFRSKYPSEPLTLSREVLTDSGQGPMGTSRKRIRF